MQQLLQITTVPLKYEMQIDPARLDYEPYVKPVAHISTTSGQFRMDSTPIQMRLDTYDVRHSLGFSTEGDRVAAAADKGQANLSRFISDNVQMGHDLSNAHKGVTVGNLIRQKLLRQPSSGTVFIPNGKVGLSWQPGDISTEYQNGDVKFDWQIKDPNRNYTRGRVSLNITQYADVQIKYVGSPMYVPPSASPDYVAKPET